MVGTSLCPLHAGWGSLYSNPPHLSSPALPWPSHCAPHLPPPYPRDMKDRALGRVWDLGMNSVTMPHCVARSPLTLSLLICKRNNIGLYGMGWFED